MGVFIGRYQWEVLPIPLAFGGFYLLRLWAARPRRAATLAGVGGVLTVAEAALVVSTRPTALSFSANSWDPAIYPGWWGRLDPSPELNYLFREVVQRPQPLGVACVVSLLAAALVTLPRLEARPRVAPRAISAALLVIAALSWAICLRSPFQLPEPIGLCRFGLGAAPVAGPGVGNLGCGPEPRRGDPLGA